MTTLETIKTESLKQLHKVERVTTKIEWALNELNRDAQSMLLMLNPNAVNTQGVSNKSRAKLVNMSNYLVQSMLIISMQESVKDALKVLEEY